MHLSMVSGIFKDALPGCVLHVFNALLSMWQSRREISATASEKISVHHQCLGPLSLMVAGFATVPPAHGREGKGRGEKRPQPVSDRKQVKCSGSHIPSPVFRG